MGILILFVLAVGAGTIVFFVYKGVAAFWRKVGSGEVVDIRRDTFIAGDDDEFWGRSHSWQHDGSRYNGLQNNGFGRGW